MTIATQAQDHQEETPGLPGFLVDPVWLENHIADQRLRLVDLRDREAFSDGHIPGAVQLDLEDLGHSREGCDHVLLPPAEFEGLMARLGVSNLDTVVAYDDHWGLPSARLIWALHYFGHRAAVVLNGGWDRWQEEGRPTTELPRSDLSVPENPDGSAPKKTNHFAAHPNPDVAADYEWITGALARGDVILLDTRSPTEFDQGHLPGAASWEWFNAVPAGSWECSRDPDALRSELGALGVHPSDEVVAYCRSGMRAAHTYLVLRHAGFERVRLYDGSWQEWSMRSTPRQQGEG